MRNNYTICLLLGLIALMPACEPERIIFEGPYFVRFTDESQTLRESFSKVIEIPVHIAGPVQDRDVRVFYTVGGDAREGVDYQLLGDVDFITIEEGEHFGYIRVQLINNANNIIRSQKVTFQLIGTDDASIRTGQGESDLGKTFTLTIFDDCILGGDYKGQRSAFSIPVDDIQVTSEDCETYLLSNWNVDIFNTPFDMDLTFIDNADNTLTIPEQEEDALPEDLATISGYGSVDPVTRVIDLTIILVDFEDQPEVSFRLIPD